MKNIVSLEKIAKVAGTSISTVSRYMANPTAVKKSSREAIELALNDYQYVPNVMARNLKKGGSNIVGFVAHDISQKTMIQIIKSLNKVFYENDYLLITCDSDNSVEKEQKHIEHLLSQNCALIILATCGGNVKYLKSIIKNRVKLILFDRDEPELDCICLCENHLENAKSISNYLISQNHSDFIILTGPENSYTTKQRLLGIEKSLSEHNLSLDNYTIIKNLNTTQQTKEVVSSIVQTSSVAKTILFLNPKCAGGILEVCYENHLIINKDIFVAGFTSENFKKSHNIVIPSVIQSTIRQSDLMANFALGAIKDPDFKNEKIIHYTDAELSF